MTQIIGFLREYLRQVHKTLLVSCMLLMAVLVYYNYAHGLEEQLASLPWLPWSYFSGHVILFLLAWCIPYGLFFLIQKKNIAVGSGFWSCFILAPFLFAFKMALDSFLIVSDDPYWNEYWNTVLYWPLRVLALSLLLYLIWYLVHRPEPLYGLSLKRSSLRPYFIMLLIMVPLIALAATQPDFQHTYPKLKQVLPLPESASPHWWYLLLFELSYGSDFFSIEFFFRGFLVIGFARWVGRDAILPMACFYCAIHFGKPLGECISSFFGGMLLGIVSFHTRSIYGGLIVHLGIAWLMELAGWLSHLYKW